MDRATTADMRARSSLSKAQEHLKNEDVKEAIEALSAHLQGNQLTAVGFQCLEMLADLCLAGDKQDVQKLIGVLQRCRVQLRGTQHLEDSVQHIVDLVMTRTRQMCVRAKERAEEMQRNPSAGERMLAAMNGVSLAALAEKRHINPCNDNLRLIIAHFCRRNNIGFAKKLIFIYNKTVRQFLALCKEFNAPARLYDVSTHVAQAISYMALDQITERDDARSRAMAQELKKERNDFLTSTAAVTEMVETLCCLLNDICTMRQYGGALKVLSCLKRVCDKVQRNEELTDVVSGAYETMSDVFWTCSVYNYHAFCLSTAASLKRQEKRGPLAARAMLATLCVAEADVELDPFGRHREKSPELDELFDYPSTRKTSLLEHLKMKGVYGLASPEIVRLATNLEDPNFTDFAGLHRSVTALTSAHADLARYNEELHHVILRYQLECLAVSCNHVDVLTVAAYNGSLTAADYVNTIEPVILDDESLSVEIDSRTNTLAFSDSSKAKMLSHFKEIVSSVDNVPASSVSASAGRYSDFAQAGAASPRKVLTVSAADLEAARERSWNIYCVQHKCIESKDKRAENKKAAEEKKRQDTISERRVQEEGRRIENESARMEKLRQEYQERQRQERGKEVLRKLRIKYPGFKVDDSIVYRSAAAFEDELTRVLATFKRRSVDNERKDILQENLYERAIRALEIPARRAHDAENVEHNRAERVAARENALAEHRREYERGQNERRILSKFLDDAAQYEQRWLDTASTIGGSKRDAQQNLLEEEMRRLAQQ